MDAFSTGFLPLHCLIAQSFQALSVKSIIEEQKYAQAKQ